MQIRKIKSWKEAEKAVNADANVEYRVDKVDDNDELAIFGIREREGSWGNIVNGYECGEYFYANDGFVYPVCVTEEYNEDDGSTGDDIQDYILCHGEIITDDEMFTDANQYVRIRLISCDGVLYYYKTVSGEAVERKIVSRTDG